MSSKRVLYYFSFIIESDVDCSFIAGESPLIALILLNIRHIENCLKETSH
jgi:hypothetical protein